MGIHFAPVWHSFYVLLIVVLSVQLMMKIVALRSGEQVLIKPLELVANFIGIIAIWSLAFARQLVVSSNPTADVQQLVTVNTRSSLWLGLCCSSPYSGCLRDLEISARTRTCAQAARCVAAIESGRALIHRLRRA